MAVAKIPIGRAPPHDINVVVEIAQGGNPVKYELDKANAEFEAGLGGTATAERSGLIV